ncbi:MAG: hypothetical protein IPM59_01210 [Chloracidobacterium sp.]|nr:hypothetical protein [Chloracidobacterium sp.]
MKREKEDPGIAWIREVRHKISARFDHDTKRLIDHYIEYQKKFADRLEPVTKAGKPEPAEVVGK